MFHLAAIYDLAVTREVAQLVNVEGTRNVNEFAKSITNLRRYHYVSTCYVAGRRSGLIREDELEHAAQAFAITTKSRSTWPKLRRGVEIGIAGNDSPAGSRRRRFAHR